ncbi:MAG: Bacterial archaeo-eukaryotic release factor family 12 [Devosia sp.]|nr:Bacterial archaeo-eukaryotic release factor family 12 [Devosia sp.]
MNLVLAADPQDLVQLRGTVHKTVSASIIASLDKELTNNSANDIAGSCGTPQGKDISGTVWPDTAWAAVSRITPCPCPVLLPATD